LFHYQAESSPMPEQFNKEGRTNPLAWASTMTPLHTTRSLTKLIRYDGILQRRRSRSRVQRGGSPSPPPKKQKNEANPISRRPWRPERQCRAGPAPKSRPGPYPAEAPTARNDNLTPNRLQLRPRPARHTQTVAVFGSTQLPDTAPAPACKKKEAHGQAVRCILAETTFPKRESRIAQWVCASTRARVCTLRLHVVSASAQSARTQEP